MHEQQLTLEHRALVQEALKTNGVPLSEYSFTNLYLFRDVHKYTIVQDGPCAFIKGETRDGHPYAMPLCDLGCFDMEKIRRTAEAVGTIFPVMERDLEHFDPAVFEWSHNIDDSDYLFTVEKMATFPGRHLHKKRNLLKQFLETYSWRVEPLTAERVAEAMSVLNEWQRDFPLEPRPFARIAQAVGAAEEDVIAAYRDLAAQGLVSRVGAVFAPRRLGASALAALSAPGAAGGG